MPKVFPEMLTERQRYSLKRREYSLKYSLKRRRCSQLPRARLWEGSQAGAPCYNPSNVSGCKLGVTALADTSQAPEPHHVQPPWQGQRGVNTEAAFSVMSGTRCYPTVER